MQCKSNQFWADFIMIISETVGVRDSKRNFYLQLVLEHTLNELNDDHAISIGYTHSLTHSLDREAFKGQYVHPCRMPTRPCLSMPSRSMPSMIIYVSSMQSRSENWFLPHWANPEHLCRGRNPDVQDLTILNNLHPCPSIFIHPFSTQSQH